MNLFIFSFHPLFTASGISEVHFSLIGRSVVKVTRTPLDNSTYFSPHDWRKTEYDLHLNPHGGLEQAMAIESPECLWA
jgi:hypothetical protein